MNRRLSAARLCLLFVLFVAPLGAQPVADLVSHWTLDDGSGSVATDALGSNDGDVIGAQWTSGQVGAALDFDGVDDTVSIPDSADFTLSSYTASYWVNVRSFNAADQSSVLSKWSSGGNRQFILGFGKTGDYYFALGRSSCTRTRTTGEFPGTAPPLGVWTHVTWVQDATLGLIRLYENGVEIAATSYGNDLCSDSDTDLRIGSRSTDDEYFDGLVDNVRLYSRALSAAEVDTVYQSDFSDEAPPARFDLSPSGVLLQGTTSTTLSLSTNEAADCRYSVIAGTLFEDMVDAFAADASGRQHTADVFGLLDGFAYVYYVRCQDASGNTNPDDASVSFAVSDVPDVTPPTIPQNLTGFAVSSSIVDLTWEASTDDFGVAGYNVYRDGGLIATVSTTSHTDSDGLLPSNAYSYTVTAFDLTGNESFESLPEVVNTPAATLSFTDITATAGTAGPDIGGHGIQFADIDGDGLTDYYLTNIFEDTGPRADLFFRNLGNNVFAEEAALRGIDDLDGGTHGATWADLDNDGDFDLFNGTTWNTAGTFGNPDHDNVYRNDGAGFFTDETSPSMETVEIETRGVIAFDLEGDGDLDLYGVPGLQAPGGAELIRNDGNFQFTAITTGVFPNAVGVQGVTDTDYDGDGDTDVLVANRAGPIVILQNQGGGDFVEVDPGTIGISEEAEDGLTTGDVDNDGYLDLLLATDNNGWLYLNDGDGTFTFSQSFSDTDGYMGGFADLDNDGDLDLVFAGDNVAYINDGGVFSEGPSISYDRVGDPRAIAFADIDNDGDLDFAVASKREPNSLIRNDYDAGGFLKVELVGPQGQAGAFGAKVTIFAAGDLDGTIRGLREAKSAYGYLGQDDPILHFGLGSLTAVDVRVDFPGGATVVRTDVAADQKILVDARDDTPPSTPAGLFVAGVTETTVDLGWLPANDPDTGISHYNVYRDGALAGSTGGTSFTDTALMPGVLYSYAVTAVNGSGIESGLSLPVPATTLADTTPPSLLSLDATETAITLLFDEEIEIASATDIGNYAIDNGVVVLNAVLDGSLLRVTLTTTAHSEGLPYTLLITGVSDLAGNAIAPTASDYTVEIEVVDPDQVAHWKLDDGAVDGAQWTSGQVGGALDFDGVDDSVSVPDAADFTFADFTISYWVNVGSFDAANESVVVSKWSSGANRQFLMGYGKTGDYYFAIGRSNCTRNRIVAEFGGTAPPLGVWTHVTWVQDAASGQMTLYENGLELASTTYPNDVCSDSEVELRIGARALGDEHFDGLIDSVRIYRRSLTAPEVEAVFQSESIDETAPVRSNAAPTGSLPAGTTSTTISVETNEEASCRYAVVAGTPFQDMTDLFGADPTGRLHSASVSGLVDGGSYVYYVRCQDTSGNTNLDDLPISFTVEVPDLTPPTVPAGVFVAGVDLTTVDLGWSPSDDLESGVSHYNVYRDGLLAGSTPGVAFTDTGRVPGTTYSYEITAVNGAGLESGASSPIEATTDIDSTPPSLLSVEASETAVTLVFDEALDAATATDLASYSIDNGVSVLNALLDGSLTVVTLTTTAHAPGVTHTILVSGVTDLAGNAIAPTASSYTFDATDPDLMAHWTLDDGSGSVATDAVGANDGAVIGAQWTSGQNGGALDFDGVDDTVSIPDSADLTLSSFTVSYWVNVRSFNAADQSAVLSRWSGGANRQFILGFGKTGDYYFALGRSSCTRTRIAEEFPGTAPPLGVWIHVAWVQDATLGLMRLYENGVEIAATSYGNDLCSDSDTDLRIAARSTDDEYFDGLIDDVRLYRRVLNGTEVEALATP